MTEAISEFGPFTLNQVKHAFDAFDLDHNKYVGAAELRHIYTSIGEDVTDDEIDEMIHMVDTDGDGQVDFEEFAKMIFRYAARADDDYDDEKEKKKKAEAKAGNALGAVDSQHRLQSIRDTMTSLKLDSIKMSDLLHEFTLTIDQKEIPLDGQLVTYEKFLALMDIEDVPLASKLFRLFDADNSGTLTMKEFLINISNFAPESSKDDRIKFAFKLFDQDGSGSLDKMELLQILKTNYMADNVDQVAAKADAIMRQADRDKSGEISFEEFVLVCKRFPNLMFPKL